MTSPGSLQHQFERACQRRDLLAARTYAAQMPRITPEHALALLLLIREAAPETYPRAAVRFHARLCTTANVALEDAAALLSALHGLVGPSPAAAEVVTKICEAFGVDRARRIVDAALDPPPRWPRGAHTPPE